MHTQSRQAAISSPARMVYDFRDYTRFHSWLNPFIDLPVDVLVSVFGGDPFMSSGMLLVSRNKPPVSTLTHLDITTVTPVDRFSLFSTPLYVYDMPQMEVVNHELTQRLLTESEASPGIRRSNRGGWHSAPDLGHRSEACYRTVMQMMIDQVAATIHDLAASMRMPAPPPMRYSAQAWAMVMRDGDYTIVHDHATAHWSVSYYVDAGDADVDNHPESGLFAVLDPRRYSRPIPGLDDFSMTQFTVRPRSGRLVIFPGWLQHYVHPYRGTRPRIAIACNVSVAPELLNPSPTLG